MNTNPYQPSTLDSDADAAVLSDREYGGPKENISEWRILVAFLLTYLTSQVSFVLVSAAYLAAFQTYNETRDVGLGNFLGQIPALIVFGAAFTCIPIFFFAGLLNVVALFGVRRTWPTSVPYTVSAALTSLIFVGFLCMFSQSISDTVLSLTDSADSVKNVSRPGLCMNEIPLLLIALMAGLLGTWLSLRTLRGGQAQP